jgi:hypothetical protein
VIDLFLLFRVLKKKCDAMEVLFYSNAIPYQPNNIMHIIFDNSHTHVSLYSLRS